VDFDRFIDEFIDLDAIDPYDPLGFFTYKFKKPTATLLKEYEAHIQQAKEELKVLQESKDTQGE
jgi:hypothetical protein